MKKFSFNFLYLKYFFDAARLGSVSQSAKNNFVSQSAISQAIIKLEKSMGCGLIIHQPNRLKLTEEGKKLFESSRAIFQAIQKAEETFFTDQPKTIEFACTHSFAIAFLSERLKQVRKLYPALQVNFRLAHAFDIMDWVKKGMIDFGILLDNSDLSPFHSEEIWAGYYQLYISPKYDETEPPQFLLDSEERIETNLLKKSYTAKYGKPLSVLMEIANLVEEGLGIGFFPDYVAKKHPTLTPYKDDIVTIPYKIYAIFATNAERSTHITEFLSVLKKNK